MLYVIGVDIGGTQLRAGLVAADGTIYAYAHAPTLGETDPPTVLARVLDLIDHVRAALPADGSLLGIGVGAPGPLDPTTGIVFGAPNMVGWHSFPLREAIATPTALPVWLENDANVAALGEWRFGIGQGTRHLVYVTISTGIGGGAIVDGQLLLGRMGAATELGSIFLDAEHGLRWEALASGTALARAAAAAMPRHPESILHTLATPTTVQALHVAQAAASGDALAQQLMDREAHLLGLGFASILHIFSPEIIIVGGSVILNNPDLLQRARSIAYQHTLVDLYRDVPILAASLGDRAGVLGAASLVFTPS